MSARPSLHTLDLSIAPHTLGQGLEPAPALRLLRFWCDRLQGISRLHDPTRHPLKARHQPHPRPVLVQIFDGWPSFHNPLLRQSVCLRVHLGTSCAPPLWYAVRDAVLASLRASNKIARPFDTDSLSVARSTFGSMIIIAHHAAYSSALSLIIIAHNATSSSSLSFPTCCQSQDPRSGP